MFFYKKIICWYFLLVLWYEGYWGEMGHAWENWDSLWGELGQHGVKWDTPFNIVIDNGIHKGKSNVTHWRPLNMFIKKSQIF